VQSPDPDEAARRNWRTVIILLSIAAVFFLGVIAKRVIFG
jgi:hypothetical protein